MKYIDPSEKVEKQLLSEEVVKNYGSTKLLLAPKDIPDLQFEAAGKKDKGDSPEKTEVMEIMDVDTKCSVIAPRNSDFREHSLESAAGKALELVSEQKSVKQALDSELPSNTSEYREHSQKSHSSSKPTDVETARKLVKRTLSSDTHLQHSECREYSQNSRIQEPGLVEVRANDEDARPTAASSNFSKHSQNSLSNGEPKVDQGEAKVTSGDRNGQCLVTANSENSLQTRGWKRKIQKTDKRSIILRLCAVANPANIRRIR